MIGPRGSSLRPPRDDFDREAMPPAVMSKAAFAKQIKVTPARISQLLTTQAITPASLVGTGRGAKLAAYMAAREITSRRDPSQGTGLNGLNTRLDFGLAAAPPDFKPLGDDFFDAFAAMLVNSLAETYDFDRGDAVDLLYACANAARDLAYDWELGRREDAEASTSDQLSSPTQP